MKLEIKYLAPYLPYGLQAKFKERNDKRCRKYVIGTIHGMYDNGSIVCYDTVNATPDKFKLLLHPKSYIEYLLNNCEYNWTDETNLKLFLSVNGIKLDDMPFSTVQILFENHIDIFNLIPNKLAISM